MYMYLVAFFSNPVDVLFNDRDYFYFDCQNLALKS